MLHPYIQYEESPLWRALDAGISALEDNGDLALTTAREYVVGFLCRHLAGAGVVTRSVALRGEMVALTTREWFAGFLESVADGRSDLGEWSELAITHYPDAAMEQARVRAVRLISALPVGAVLAEDASEELRKWARELREAAG